MKVLDYLEEWIIAFLMGAATLLIFVAVVHRYAAGMPIPGLQDASGWRSSAPPMVCAPASTSAST